jgi:DNA-binding transcriptional LysR family regulator
MDRLADMQLFAAIVEANGLAAGGRRFGLSPASVTARLAALEARLGVALLNRTTRSLSLTDEGQIFLDGTQRILSDAAELDERLCTGRDRLFGRIRIAAPLDLGRNRVAQLLDQFMALHEGVAVELILSDGNQDLVGSGIDLALRYGVQQDSSLKIRKLANSQRIICAAPSYIKHKGRAETPEQLADHDCLVMIFGDQKSDRWPFEAEGRSYTVAVSGKRCSNDGELIRRWAVGGLGIALKSRCDVEDDLAHGRLVQLLADYAPTESGLNLVWPSGRNLPRRIRALIDFLGTQFEGNGIS